MRGQKLFVRAIEPGDAVPVREFLASNGHAGDALPQFGLIGKLLGQIVAVMAISFAEPHQVRIESLTVARDLRRKRIGRVMVDELEAFAVRMERDWLIADAGEERDAFLRHVGFDGDGPQMMRKVVR